MTPRRIRDGLAQGTWTSAGGRVPEAPPEWPEYRRERLRVAVRAARLFIVFKKSYRDIYARLREDKLVSRGLTRARVGQYVQKGTEFLLDRAYFEEVSHERNNQ